MMQNAPAIYKGMVRHVRLRPKVHKLAYRVFTLWLDLDELEQTAQTTRWFSYNRHNLVSFFDRDHGRGTGKSLAAELREDLAAHADLANVHMSRINVLCYPRICGYVFNPLTVFYAYDRSDRLRAIVYEVSNTFNERRSYIIPVNADHRGTIYQSCRKELYVSPFLPIAGGYSFHVTQPTQTACVGVNYRDKQGPMLKAFFEGERIPLSATNLFWTAVRIPFLTLKVTLAIHYEAAKLWFKKIALVKRDRTGPFNISNIPGRKSSTPEVPGDV